MANAHPDNNASGHHIGVATGTYGDRDYWAPLVTRAQRSVQAQTMQCQYQWVHADTLHEARNDAARALIKRGCEWLIFLDADDELDKEYVRLMSFSVEHSTQLWPVAYPSTLGVKDGVEDPLGAHLNDPTDLLDQNFVTIGAMHKAEMFTKIGGFDDYPVLEDWAYWLKAYVRGARFHPCAHAIYRIFLDRFEISRNNSSRGYGDVPAQIRQTYRNYQAMMDGAYL